LLVRYTIPAAKSRQRNYYQGSSARSKPNIALAKQALRVDLQAIRPCAKTQEIKQHLKPTAFQVVARLSSIFVLISTRLIAVPGYLL
jgi:hypothetical protein